MTREILLPATPSLMCWVAIDRAMRLAISVKSAKAAPRSVSSGDARGKAEANLALCGEVDAVPRRRTLGGCAHHRGGRRRTTQFFGIVGAPPRRPWCPRHSPVRGPSSSISSSSMVTSTICRRC
jgi:hypothetical protein